MDRDQHNLFELSRASSLSSRQDRDGDEKALAWATLQKLPMNDLLTKGILCSSEGGVDEVDVLNLGYKEKKILFDKLLKDGEDNETLLVKLKDRFQRVGIEIPKIEVRFEHLNVEAEAYAGSRSVGNVFSYYINFVEGILRSLNLLTRRKKNLTILHDTSGIIKPGRMTLLLGPPSSGKTTLLLALCGKLDCHLKASGRVTYNDLELHEFVPQRIAAYISQHDLHVAEMTVRETLEFSARCQGVGSRYELLAELCRRENEASIIPDPNLDIFMKALAAKGAFENVVTDYVLKILGLESCADTMVGSQMIRGISGGQKKRLTVGEMMVGPAQAFFMDEISTGLDSSTTFKIMKSICNYVHILDGTALISLLQPEPETYDLFDDIILLSDSFIIYHGPRDTVLNFFGSMGFKCPKRKRVADFLLEVTSRKDQHQYWARIDVPYQFITAEEFGNAFKSFHVGSNISRDIVIPFDRSKNLPASFTRSKYGANTMEHLRACFSREYLLMKRNSFFYIFKLSQLLAMGAIAMTSFFRTKMHKDTIADGTVFMGALFYTVSRIILNEYPEILLTVSKLPIFYKQRDLLFFSAWAGALPASILKIPIQLLGGGTLVFVSYYVTGYDPEVARMFKQFLMLVCTSLMASSLFRFVGAVTRTPVAGNSIGAFVMLYLIIFSGFSIPRENIDKWMAWNYWLSPSMYAVNGISVNEFLGRSWNHGLPEPTVPLGVEVLKSRGYFTYAYWYWLSVGAVIGFTVLLYILYPLTLTVLNSPGRAPKIMLEVEQEESNKEKENKRKRMAAICSFKESYEANYIPERGMIIPFEKHCVTFDEIRYSVDMPKEMIIQGAGQDRLELLKGISGVFRPGILTALMGVSGAGKTTLFDVLSGRKTAGYIEGDVKISGYPKKEKTFARVSGYCEQNDIHSPHVTVYESLLYSAWLRLSPNIEQRTRKVFIEEVMELVELTPLRDVLVGSPGGTGLSIEQQKRLTVAVELVANPSIIFMDEPTSGLDARSAAIVMRTVRNTVDTGRTVVCTIHQPSIDIFESFDELILLKQGGQQIYTGPLGHHSCHLTEYFESIEGVPKIKNDYNPASWMLEVTSPAQELLLGIDFAEIYRNSEQYRINKSQVEELSIPEHGSSELFFPTRYSQSFCNQVVACLWKQYWSYWRQPSYNGARFAFTTITALVTGIVFRGIGSNIRKEPDVFSVVSSMFGAMFFICLPNAYTMIPVAAAERRVFYRERAAGTYSTAAYALAEATVEIPYVLIQTLLFGGIAYTLMGLEFTATKFLLNLVFMFFTFLTFTYYALMMVALTPNEDVAGVCSSFFFSIWCLFAGFVIPLPRIPIWWKWFYWICPIAYALYGLVVSQFGDVDDMLEEGITVRQYVSEYFGYKPDYLGVAVAGVVAFPLMFVITFALALKLLNFQRR